MCSNVPGGGITTFVVQPISAEVGEEITNSVVAYFVTRFVELCSGTNEVRSIVASHFVDVSSSCDETSKTQDERICFQTRGCFDMDGATAETSEHQSVTFYSGSVLSEEGAKHIETDIGEWWLRGLSFGWEINHHLYGRGSS